MSILKEGQHFLEITEEQHKKIKERKEKVVNLLREINILSGDGGTMISNQVKNPLVEDLMIEFYYSDFSEEYNTENPPLKKWKEKIEKIQEAGVSCYVRKCGQSKNVLTDETEQRWELHVKSDSIDSDTSN